MHVVPVLGVGWECVCPLQQASSCAYEKRYFYSNRVRQNVCWVMRRAGTSSIAGSIFAGNTAQAGFGGAVRSAGCPSLAISATTFASNYAKQVGAQSCIP